VNTDWRERLAQYDDEQLDARERAALDLLLANDLEARAYLAALRADRRRLQDAFAVAVSRRPPGAARDFTAGVMARVTPRRRAWFPAPRLLEVCAAALMVCTLWGVQRHQRGERDDVACANRLKDLTRVVLTYAQDYDERLPDARRWLAQVEQHTGRPYNATCPSDHRDAGGSRLVSYGLPYDLSGSPLSRVPSPSAQVAAFDADGVFLDLRHGRAANVSYLDGRVSRVSVPRP